MHMYTHARIHTRTCFLGGALCHCVRGVQGGKQSPTDELRRLRSVSFAVPHDDREDEGGGGARALPARLRRRSESLGRTSRSRGLHDRLGHEHRRSGEACQASRCGT